MVKMYRGNSRQTCSNVLLWALGMVVVLILCKTINIQICTKYVQVMLSGPRTNTYVTSTTGVDSSFGISRESADVARDVLPSQAGDGSKHILLVTYMRGGSSFVGDLFNHNPNAFYWFEPLAPLFVDMLGPQADSRNWFFNDDLVQRNFQTGWKEKFFSALEDIFHCNISRLPAQVLRHKFATNVEWNKSSKLAPYRKCWRHPDYKSLSPNQRAWQCAKLAEEHCRNSSVRVIKTVRMNMNLVDDFVSRLPDVKIVHVIRDPRAILNSRWVSSRDHRVSNYTKDAELLCMQMLSDSQTKDLLDELTPGVFTTVRYEDLALKKVTAVQQLYTSLGLGHVPEQVKLWVNLSTESKADNGPLGTLRRNATAVVSQWTSALSTDIQEYITEECANTLQEYHYLT